MTLFKADAPYCRRVMMPKTMTVASDATKKPATKNIFIFLSFRHLSPPIFNMAVMSCTYLIIRINIVNGFIHYELIPNDPAMNTLCTYNVLIVNIFLMGGFALEYVALGRGKT